MCPGCYHQVTQYEHQGADCADVRRSLKGCDGEGMAQSVGVIVWSGGMVLLNISLFVVL